MVMTSLLMSSPSISISHRLCRCRYSISRNVVASSPSFSRPAARVARRACSQAIIFYRDHNEPLHLPPPPRPPPTEKKKKENYITIVFTFSWVLQSCQEKSKTVVMQNFGSKQGALWTRWNCGWSQLINLNHNPARATPILYLCHGVFTDPFIFRQILGHFFPRKYRIHTRKTKRYLETIKKLGLKVLLTGLWNLKDIQNSRHWKPSKK